MEPRVLEQDAAQGEVNDVAGVVLLVRDGALVALVPLVSLVSVLAAVLVSVLAAALVSVGFLRMSLAGFEVLNEGGGLTGNVTVEDGDTDGGANALEVSPKKYE